MGDARVVPERVERRLAAILAADVVGYSRLMEAEDSGTLAQLKTHRKEVIERQFLSMRVVCNFDHVDVEGRRL